MAPVAILSHSQNSISVPSAYASIIPTLPLQDIVKFSSTPRRAPKERTPPVRTAFAFDTIESAIAAVARGEFVVVMDDESRENEGDLIIPAVGCSTEQMAWMIKHTRYGLFPLTPPRTPYSPDLMRFTSPLSPPLSITTQWVHLHLAGR